jgi:fatty acid synthase
VLFQEALQHVPKKVVLVEIAPHALLQSILKRSVSDSAVVLGLVKKTEPDNVEYFLSSLGR